TDHERHDARRAGLIYLVATHTGTLALFGMFAMWGAYAGDWTFASLGVAAGALPARGAAVLLLAGAGFGLKVGVVPFHFWLPPAHAAAPSHVSALLSGVVIKTGVYGVLRVMTLLGATPAWWGWTVLTLGVASGVLGVLWARAQHDLKRLLAYHSVENIGIILMGIGIGALGATYGYPSIAVIGYAGALLHTLNHALFKSLLFLGAGAVQRATGTRDMEALGGLAKPMPLTWAAFLVGATAIVGLPPLNGFVSEWLVYQGLLRSGQLDAAMRLAMLGVPALALIGALALACFAKAAGIVFLGQPRSAAAATAREGAAGLLTPMFVIAGVCLTLGVAAPLGVSPALRVAATFVPLSDAARAEVRTLAVQAAWIGVVASGLILALVAGWLLMRALRRRRSVRLAETWGCGYDMPNARMQYTASSYAAPLLSAFGKLSGVRTDASERAFHTTPRDLVLDGIGLPLWESIRRTALRMRALQQGRLYVYLIYVLAALLALLIFLAIDARVRS
ncbi:MAG: proton-conducting transporter membrane subunit, partial [Gemmatimonadota bacterium]